MAKGRDDWTTVEVTPRSTSTDPFEFEITIDSSEIFETTERGRNLGQLLRHLLIQAFLSNCYVNSANGSVSHRSIATQGKNASKGKILVAAFKIGAMRAKIGDKGAATDVSDAKIRELGRRLSLQIGIGKADRYGRWHVIERGLATLVAYATGGNTDNLVHQLFEREYIGESAIKEFEANLKKEKAEPKTLTFVAQSDERKQLIHRICDLLCNDPAVPIKMTTVKNVTTPRMLVNVYGDGQWRDLAALAQEVETTVRNRIVSHNVPKLVRRISLARYAQTEEENPGKFALTFDDLLFELCQKLRIRIFDVSFTPGRINSFAMVRAIRARLAEEPHILIFDGYYESSKQSEDSTIGVEMLRIARDDHLKNLLIRLLEPPIAGAEFPTLKLDDDIVRTREIPIDVQQYRQNRIVVFSNRKISYLSTSVRESNDVAEVKLNLPTFVEMEGMLKLSKLQYKSAILRLFNQNDRLSLILYEPFYDLLDAHLSMLFGRKNAERNQPLVDAALEDLFDSPSLPDIADYDALMDWLMAHHLTEMRARNRAVFDLHALISLVPCGLKLLTLARIQGRAQDLTVRLTPSGKARPGPFAALLGSNLAQLTKLLRSFEGGLLTQDQPDSFQAYDEAPLPFESVLLKSSLDPNTVSSDAGQSTGQSENDQAGFDFKDPVMKECLGRILIDRQFLKKSDIAVLNRMLCEEALSQQTIALRYRGPDHTPSVRAFRRQISGIYHGLLSLGIKGRGTEIDTQVQISCSYFAGPTDPKAFYKWLYLIHFRRIIEDPPNWRLSRHYALDRLKLDLLEAFDKPSHLLRTDSSMASSASSASLIEALFHAEFPEVVEDYLINVTHASTGISDIRKTQDASRRRSELSQVQRERDRKSLPGPVQMAVMPHSKDRLEAIKELKEVPPEIARLKEQMNRNILTAEFSAQECWMQLWCVIDGITIEEITRKWRNAKRDSHSATFLATLNRMSSHRTKNFELRDRLEKAVRDCVLRYVSILKRGGRSEDAHRKFDYSDTIESLNRGFKKSSDALINFVDVLFRISEFIAIEAELLRCGTASLFPETRTLSTSQRNMQRKMDEVEQWHSHANRRNRKEYPQIMLCVSIAVFQLAEELRLNLEAGRPMAAQFYSAGHAARQFIRSTLALERSARDVRFTKLSDDDPIMLSQRLGFFNREARRVSERLCQNLHPYSLERAEMMILESKMHRVLSEPIRDIDRTSKHWLAERDLREQSLEQATRYLAEAEHIVVGLSRRNRVRMRLALERGKLNRARANLQEDQAAKRKFLDLAVYDAVDLQKRAETNVGIIVWKILAASEVTEIDKKIREYNRTHLPKV